MLKRLYFDNDNLFLSCPLPSSTTRIHNFLCAEEQMDSLRPNRQVTVRIKLSVRTYPTLPYLL